MLDPGQIFASRYRIRRSIAEGGMAAIFEAEHLGTERRVALKLLFPHVLSMGNAREKFELEAKISTRVNSPHIVQVLDAATDPQTGASYLVMELLEGETLARRVATRGPLPLEQALQFLEQVAAGLDAAHGYREPGGAAKPIVHRDLKPENLFLSQSPGGLVSAKILDYGIAKVLGDRLQISQEVRGTPLFMAVEQITASSLSPQTDIWAYGLIAHYALTGTHYWRSAWREDAGVQAVFAEILTLPLDAPSARWRELGVTTTLPRAFDGWLLRCINRDPARRFPQAGVAFQALREALGGRAASVSRGRPSEAAGSAAPIEHGSGSAPSLTGERSAAAAPLEAASSTGSVPAMATTQHRASLAVLALRLRPSRWLAAAAGVAAVVAGLGGAAAWVVGGSEPTGHALGAPAGHAAPASEAEHGASAAAQGDAGAPPALDPSLAGEPQSPIPTHVPASAPQLHREPHLEPAAASRSQAASTQVAPPSIGVAPAANASPPRQPPRRVSSPGGRSSPATSIVKVPDAAKPTRAKRRPTPVRDAYEIR